MDKKIPNFATSNINIWFFTLHTIFEIGLNWVTNCSTGNLRRSLYFSNGIPTWLINLINPSQIYDGINPSPVRWFRFFSCPSPIYKINPNPVS